VGHVLEAALFAMNEKAAWCVRLPSVQYDTETPYRTASTLPGVCSWSSVLRMGGVHRDGLDPE